MKKLLLLIVGCWLMVFSTKAQVIPEWENEYGNDTQIQYITNDMVLDKSGNVYVTGYLFAGSNPWSCVTLKYSNNGVLLWDKVIAQAGYMSKIKVDDVGNAYICTATHNPTGGNNFLTVKYNSVGDTVWTGRFNGGTNSAYDRPRNIFVDDSMNVYVVGNAMIGATGYNSFVTLKYNVSGVQQWVAIDSTNTSDAGFDIVVDSLQNVYITGNSGDTSGALMLTFKYDRNGLLKWVKRFSGNAVGRFIRVFNNSYVYAGGITTGAGNDYAVVKYDLDGNEMWSSVFDAQAYYNSPFGNQNDVPEDMEIDKEGNVYMAGDQFEYNLRQDWAAVKFSSNGVLQWARLYDGGAGGNGSDKANSLVIDSSLNVYVAGATVDTSLNAKTITTIVYDSNGDTKYILKYPSNGQGLCDAISIGLDSLNHIYIAGMISSKILTLKYGIVSDISAMSSIREALFLLSPNPATNSVAISIDESMVGSNVTVTDVTGRVIMNDKLRMTNVQLPVAELASGIYFITVENEKGRVSKKLIKE